MTSPRLHPLIVGIGASAGGLEAFKAFLAQMPADSGMAFVLVQHLDPNRTSMLVELLAPVTAMPVHPAANGNRVEVNNVYVIPPNSSLRIAKGILRLSKPRSAQAQHRPIDIFFESLAEDQQERAVCIILSGAGSDGTEGLRAIKAHGGLCLAQADFDQHALAGMPSSAVATGLVDDVLPVKDLPTRLIKYAKRLPHLKGRLASDNASQDAAGYVARVCSLLRRTLGQDFSEYKSGTLIRRIQLRMQVHQIASPDEYFAYLEKEPHERELLAREFLIGVTHFFRDPDAFEELARVLKNLFNKRAVDDPLRIWVPGCATGEEAFSLAILVKEAIGKRSIAPKVQIFATDLDEHAVTIARAARYPASRLSRMSEKRCKRWFVKDGEYYGPIKEIRELCVFSTHNVGKDPPFSKLDLISCRNVLIYFGPALQDRVLRIFHYALRRDGYLFLGTSEGVARHGRLFTTLDKKCRIYQRRDTGATELPQLAAPPHWERAESPPSSRELPPAENNIEKTARRIMEKHVPPYVVVAKDYEVLRFSGETDLYLGPTPGAASLNLFSLLRRSLRPTARDALQEAFSTQQPVVREKVAIQTGGKRRLVDLIVEPIPDGLCVLGFIQRAALAAEETTGSTNSTAESLERELNETRQRLQANIDALETVNEELKSSNEEYQSINEELQSTNEELETSREEIQSINEELQTLNSELGDKNEHLAQSNSDLLNLKNSTNIATLFIDGQMQIRDFTPSMTDLFHLREQDRGRPVTDIANQLSYATITADIEKALRTLSVVERELSLDYGKREFVMRIWPYRRLDNKIDGVTITFVDFTDRKRAEQERAALAAIVDAALDPIIATTMSGVISSWNKAAEAAFGFTAHEAIGQSFMKLIPPARIGEETMIMERARSGVRIDHRDTILRRKDGSDVELALTASPIRDGEGNVTGISTIARDITGQKKLEAEREMSFREFGHRVKNTIAVVQSIAHLTLPDETRADFERRLQALAHVYQLALNSELTGVSIREIAKRALEPFAARDRENYLLSGSDNVHLPAKLTTLMLLTFHELATNAAKYGALSTPKGQVHVKWLSARDAGKETLTFLWEESNGPQVAPPASRGFGTKMIERSWKGFGGDVRLEFAPDGLKWRLALQVPAT